MTTEEKIMLFKKLTDDEIFIHERKHVNEIKLTSLLKEIHSDLLIDYDTQRKYIPGLLSILEESADHTIGFLIHLFLNGLYDLKKLKIMPLDLSFWDNDEIEDKTYKEFVSLMEQHQIQSQNIRMSNDVVLSIDKIQAGKFLRCAHNIIGSKALMHNFDGVDATTHLMILWITRNIAININRKDIFYFILSTFFDALIFNEDYQFARDLAEESLICSYKDDVKEFGYYLSFKVFGNSSSGVTALQYALVSNSIFLKKGIISDYVLKHYYWEAIKFMRNLKIIPIATEIFANRPTNVNYTNYELNKLHNAYFSCLFFSQDIKLPSMALEYIDKIKEDIFQSGEREALPWLAMLFNIKKNYSEEIYDSKHLNNFISIFKTVVSSENFDKLHKNLFGKSNDIIPSLKKSLLKLSNTRNETDFTTDNKVALQKSHLNILQSYIEENVEGYLLSMILQSDLSITFKNIKSPYFIKVSDIYEDRKFEDKYYSAEFLNSFILEQKESDILWLGADNHLILPLFYCNQIYTFLKDKERNLSIVATYAKNSIHTLPHSAIHANKRKHEKFFEDYEKEEKQIICDVNFFNFNLQSKNSLLIIKDIELSTFPHNLITNDNSIICLSRVISNIMSLEWYVENKGALLKPNFTKQIWIPTDSQDFTISLMHSKLENCISEFNIIENRSIIPNLPLNSDLNIIVAHGDEKISTFPAFHFSNNESTISITNFDNIVDKGEVLILFVCHAGSEKSDIFRNQTITIVKQFLQSGYKAVIAPFWALHVDIPTIWLPEFLKNIQDGKDVGTSVLNANKKVSLEFNTPKAYACLHLYGDPFIKIANKENN